MTILSPELAAAVKSGITPTVNNILDADNTQLNAVDADGNSPLFLALINGKFNLALQLLNRRNIDITLKNSLKQDIYKLLDSILDIPKPYLQDINLKLKQISEDQQREKKLNASNKIKVILKTIELSDLLPKQFEFKDEANTEDAFLKLYEERMASARAITKATREKIIQNIVINARPIFSEAAEIYFLHFTDEQRQKFESDSAFLSTHFSGAAKEQNYGAIDKLIERNDFSANMTALMNTFSKTGSPDAFDALHNAVILHLKDKPSKQLNTHFTYSLMCAYALKEFFNSNQQSQFCTPENIKIYEQHLANHPDWVELLGKLLGWKQEKDFKGVVLNSEKLIEMLKANGQPLDEAHKIKYPAFLHLVKQKDPAAIKYALTCFDTFHKNLTNLQFYSDKFDDTLISIFVQNYPDNAEISIAAKRYYITKFQLLARLRKNDIVRLPELDNNQLKETVKFIPTKSLQELTEALQKIPACEAALRIAVNEQKRRQQDDSLEITLPGMTVSEQPNASPRNDNGKSTTRQSNKSSPGRSSAAAAAAEASAAGNQYSFLRMFCCSTVVADDDSRPENNYVINIDR